MAIRLRSTFETVVQRDRAFIRRRTDGASVAALEPIEVTLLGYAESALSPANARLAVEAELGPRGLIALSRVLNRLQPLLEDGREEDGLRTLMHRRGLLPHPPSGMRQLPGPKILHWMVTAVCPRRCAYCYAEPRHGNRADDSMLSRERLQILLAEAAELGASGILFSGSEAFLRPDLPEIIGDARRQGLETLTTTKHPISRALAERLAAAGLPCLSLSVDTLDPALSRRLIGSAAYPGQVARSVESLTAAGLRFAIQAVLTPETAQYVYELAEFAERRRAAALQLVPFERVRRPIRRINQAAMQVDGTTAKQVTEKLQRQHPSLKVTLFRKGGAEACDDLHCDIGGTKLFFTPEGRTHRCYKLTDDAGLYGLDLRTHSIAAAWHDSIFNGGLVPATKDYAGTPCSGCGNFGGCNASGRCIYQAQVDHGAYAAPDRDCDRGRAALEARQSSPPLAPL